MIARLLAAWLEHDGATMAVAADAVGVSSETIRLWRHGTKEPSSDKQLCALLDLIKANPLERRLIWAAKMDTDPDGVLRAVGA